jgi:ABC-type transport system substrate-binding protein
MALALAVTAYGATRPHYGGALRVEIHETNDALPAAGFTVASWEAGRRAVYTADENAAGGRPFLDTVEIQLARPLRDQALDFGLGKAEVVELDGNEARRTVPGRSVWSSAPVRVLAIVFQARVADARIREALGLAVDRTAIHNVLLQRQGEISGALLPQWLSGYAFLFPAAADLPRARALAADAPAAARRITLSAEDPADQPMAERISLNARDAGLTVVLAPHGADPDARLVEARVTSSDPSAALKSLAAALGLPEPLRADSPEALYAAESALLEGFRAIPLFHLPDVYGAASRVQGGPGIGPLGEWRLENLWLENGKP